MKLCNLEFLKQPYLHIRKYFPSPHRLHNSFPRKDVEQGQTKRVSCSVATTFTPLRLAAYKTDGESNGKNVCTCTMSGFSFFISCFIAL